VISPLQIDLDVKLEINLLFVQFKELTGVPQQVQRFQIIEPFVHLFCAFLTHVKKKSNFALSPLYCTLFQRLYF